MGVELLDPCAIGRLNRQGAEVDRDRLTRYLDHFSPAGMDFLALPDEESAPGVFYFLIGVGSEGVEQICRMGPA
jgi:hypothetical protein